MSDHDGIDLGRLFISLDALDYQDRGVPGETLERALEISDVWLKDELCEAVQRQDITAVRNIGDAALLRFYGATTPYERIVRELAVIDAANFVISLTRQQR